jgi:hypothetical protein
MSSLASLINNIKANTAHNPLVQKNQKRKTTADSNAKQKKTKTMEESNSGPTVVVFDGSVLERKPLFEAKSEKRRFLASITEYMSWMSHVDHFLGFKSYATRQT